MDSKSNKISCVAFIMDGNRRWAKSRGRVSLEGHKAGYKKLKDILAWVKEAGIEHAIVYAFSTENWKRTKEEVGALMTLLTYALSNELESLQKEGVRLKFVGDISHFSTPLQEQMKKAEEETKSNGPLSLSIALSYGGRAEILQAVKKISLLSRPEIELLNEDNFKEYLYTTHTPDPDLIIRTGGELRLSNFLSYQSVYSELFFTETLWPDFSKEEFDSIIRQFGERKRNMGV